MRRCLVAAIERLRNGETQAEIARNYGVDATTIGRLDCADPAWSSYRYLLNRRSASAMRSFSR
jgi:hypothetical protein